MTIEGEVNIEYLIRALNERKKRCDNYSAASIFALFFIVLSGAVIFYITDREIKESAKSERMELEEIVSISTKNFEDHLNEIVKHQKII